MSFQFVVGEKNARSQQRGQTGSGVAPKLGDSKWRQGNPSQHNARSAGLRPSVDANIKKSEAGDRVQKLQQALDILRDTQCPEVDRFARSIEARRDSSPGCAHRFAGEGLRGVLVPCESTFGGTRTEAVCSCCQHQCCRTEVGHSEDAARLPATSSTRHQCRGAKIAGFGQLRGGDPDIPCGPVAKRPCRAA